MVKTYTEITNPITESHPLWPMSLARIVAQYRCHNQCANLTAYRYYASISARNFVTLFERRNYGGKI